MRSSYCEVPFSTASGRGADILRGALMVGLRKLSADSIRNMLLRTDVRFLARTIEGGQRTRLCRCATANGPYQTSWLLLRLLPRFSKPTLSTGRGSPSSEDSAPRIHWPSTPFMLGRSSCRTVSTARSALATPGESWPRGVTFGVVPCCHSSALLGSIGIVFFRGGMSDMEMYPRRRCLRWRNSARQRWHFPRLQVGKQPPLSLLCRYNTLCWLSLRLRCGHSAWPKSRLVDASGTVS